MSADLLTCERVDEEDLDTRYLAGRLSDAESAAFEEHFFACDRCWTLVQQGLVVSGALAEDRPRRARRQMWPWWGLAAAASITAVGVWQGIQGPARLDLPDATRGASERLTPTAWGDSLELRVAWPRIPGAASYRVRLYGPDGAMILERELGDTSFSLPRGSLAVSADATVHWQVFALDELRDEVARSGLVNPASTR